VRDRKLFGDAIFESVPKAKTEEEIFEAIFKYKKDMEDRAFKKSFIMSGDQLPRPDLALLESTVTKNFENKKVSIVNTHTTGDQNRKSRVAI
jgi:hypothetical protein